MLDFLKGLDIEKTDKATVELLKSMSNAIEERMKEYLNGTIDKEAMENAIAEAIKGIDSKEELKSVKEQINDVKECLVRMKGAFETKGGKVVVKSLEQQVEEQFKEFITFRDGKKVVDIKAACEQGKGKKATLNLVIEKAAAPITTTSVHNVGAFVDSLSSTEPRSESVIRQYANVAQASGRGVLYAEFAPGEGDAEWVAEGGVKPLMSGEVNEVNIVAGKVALGAKLTEETLSDFPQLVAEIRAEIISRIGLAEEEGILNGTGTGGQVQGVAKTMPGFSLSSLEVEKPNIYDAIVAGYTQIISVSNMSYRPNLVLVNPLDYAQMQLAKDVNGQYLRPFKAGDELIKGLEVVTTTAVAQGEVVMGDFNYLNIRDVWALTITFGWENDDFTKNLVTMIGEKRLVPYIKSQYKTAFLKDTIANIIAGITKE